MPLPLSHQTERRLEFLFEGEARDEARRLLEQECGTNIPFCEDSTSESMERIRFAALRISNGKLDELRRAVETAKFDWRDLLLAAGFADDVDAHSRWFPSGSSETWEPPRF